MKKHFRTYLPIWVVGIFSFLLIWQLGQFSSSLIGVDGFYHAAQGKAYFQSTEIPYPAVTYYSEYPGDPWYGYHVLIGAVDHLFFENDHTGLIEATFLLHAALGAIGMMMILGFIISFLSHCSERYIQRPLSPLYTWMICILGFLILFYAIPHFGHRAFLMQRPHILMIILVFGTAWAVLNDRKYLLVVLGALAPLSYSLSPLIFIPHAGLALGWLTTNFDTTSIRRIVTLTLYTLGGFLLGILLHPHTSSYVVNGVVFHSFAVLQSIFFEQFGLHPHTIPDEMQRISGGVPGLTFWSLLALSVIAFINDLNRESRANTWQTLMIRGFLLLGILLLIGTLFIFRIAEYAYPLVLAASFAALFFTLIPAILRLFKSVNPRMSKNRLLWVVFGFLSLVFIAFALKMHIIYASHLAAYPVQVDRYRGAAEFLSEESFNGLILLGRHDFYTQLVFYGEYQCESQTCQKRIGSGMDARMVHFYDLDFARTQDEFFGFYIDAQTVSPGEHEAMMYNFLVLNEVSYIVDDSSFRLNSDSFDLAEEYDFLEVIFQDPQYEEVVVYQVVEGRQ